MRVGEEAEAEGSHLEEGSGPGGPPLSDRMILTKPAQLLQFLFPPSARDKPALHALTGSAPEILPRGLPGDPR